MAQRSYRQYCPIAHALDAVGDRWALLVVRDLLLGPKRFGDLRAGLPGIATNVLADRLKGLEAAGVVVRRKLPPPAGSMVYELTPYGRGLEGTLVALAAWGRQTLGPVRPGQVVSEESVMLALEAAFGALAAPEVRESYEVRVEGPYFAGIFGVGLGGGGAVEVSRGAPDGPRAVVRTDVETVSALSFGQESLREATARGSVRSEGDPAAVERLASLGRRPLT